MKDSFKIVSKLTSIHSDLWSNILPVENSVADQLIEGKDRRIICSIEGIRPFHCALLPDGNGSWYILLNNKRKNELGIRDGEEISVVLEKDRSEYGMEMPIELREVLDQDEHADTLFHKLTPGRMRNIIHAVSSVKSSEIKIRRALVYAEHLKKNKGKIEFKELGQEMKEANRIARDFPS
ncbi:YdeI/OmpD-associated family protein [Cryomorphaceae bacterium 1068]|nr:YdeI/OmpD-associated family protein [Cryomorphaceae bacterium 1068]